MPPKLRPRWNLPPPDHNYAKALKHTPIYGKNSWPLIVSGTSGIFKSVKIPDENVNLGDEQSEDEMLKTEKIGSKRSKLSTNENKDFDEFKPKPKRRRFFKGTTFEPRRRKKKRLNKLLPQNVSEKQQLDNNKYDRGKGRNFNDSGIRLDVSDNVQFSVKESGDQIAISTIDSLCQSSNVTSARNIETISGLYNLEIASVDDPNTCVAQPIKMKRICSTCTTQCHWRKKRCGSLPPESDSRRQSERLIKMNFKFPFESLPDVCKFKIFSYLDLCQKGVAAQVCLEWNDLMKCPGLWSHINFSVFNPSLLFKSKVTRNNKGVAMVHPNQFPWFHNTNEYEDYKCRISKFLVFLQAVKPKLRHFSCTYDIGQPKDDWLKWICDMLESAQCLNLTYANIDWTWTPLRQPYTDRYCCLFNKMQIKYRMHEKRIRCFNQLQEVLAKAAPNLSHFKTPFDWSPRSVLLMCRLKHVRTLQLGQYMMLKGVNQEMIDTLLRNMPQLYELEMRICIPYQNSRTMYSIKHSGLKLLDISACKGFFLHNISCPQLTVLKLGRYPWKGPLVDKETNKLPCMYKLCKRGTPRLAYINRHHIQVYWFEFLYDELNTLLCKVCPCKDHLYRDSSTIPEEVNPDDEVDDNDHDDVHENDNLAGEAQINENLGILGLAAVNNHIEGNHNAAVPVANILPLFPNFEEDNEFVVPARDDNSNSEAEAGNNDFVMHKVKFNADSKECDIDPADCNTVDDRHRGNIKQETFPNTEATCVNVSEPEEQELVPLGYKTVEVRSTPYISTLPTIAAPTHVAVIPIRVVEPQPLAQPLMSNSVARVPIAIQSLSLQPQVIAVDKTTGTHVLSGPLAIVKHVIQVLPTVSAFTSATTSTRTASKSSTGTTVIKITPHVKTDSITKNCTVSTDTDHLSQSKSIPADSKLTKSDRENTDNEMIESGSSQRVEDLTSEVINTGNTFNNSGCIPRTGNSPKFETVKLTNENYESDSPVTTEVIRKFDQNS